MKKYQRSVVAIILGLSTIFSIPMQGHAQSNSEVDVFGNTTDYSAYNDTKDMLIKNYSLNGINGMLTDLLSVQDFYLIDREYDYTNRTIETKLVVSDEDGSSISQNALIKYQDNKHIYQHTQSNSKMYNFDRVQYWFDGKSYSVNYDEKYVSIDSINYENMSKYIEPDSTYKLLDITMDNLVADQYKGQVQRLSDGSVSITFNQNNIPDQLKYKYQSDVEKNYATRLSFTNGKEQNNADSYMDKQYADYSSVLKFKTGQITSFNLVMKQNDNGLLLNTHCKMNVQGISYGGNTINRTISMDKTVTNVGTPTVSAPNLNGVKVLDYTSPLYQKNNTFSSGTATFTYKNKTVKVASKESYNGKTSAYYIALDKIGIADLPWTALSAKFPDGKDIWTYNYDKSQPMSDIFTK